MVMMMGSFSRERSPSPTYNVSHQSSPSCRQFSWKLMSIFSLILLLCTALLLSDHHRFYIQRFLGQQAVLVVEDPPLHVLNLTSKCKMMRKSDGSEPLPRGIIASTSDLEMRPLWGSSPKPRLNSSLSLLAIPAGIKQKDNVNEIVNKFPESDFVVMMFHYDGVVDEWRNLTWFNRAIHVSAPNQTKWWFAKRFLHPDIVSEYEYIFLWDEDLRVTHFHAIRYLSIVKEEGLEISQPALDPDSWLHHPITKRNNTVRLHRRIYMIMDGGYVCDETRTGPPCTGWVEMMAPVFSRASWRCVWHMIQNDLIHGWGLDSQLGYCAQGDRTKNVGVVDSEYVFHPGLVTLGSQETEKQVPNDQPDTRSLVRNQSLIDWEVFKNRWKTAVEEDECWADPY